MDMILAQHGVLSGAAAEKNRNLNFDNTATTLDKNVWITGDRNPGDVNSANYIRYVNGKTIVSLGMPWTGGMGSFGRLMVYDHLNGIYPAAIEVTSKSAESDRHILPLFGVAEDGSLLVMQENKHVENINIFHGAADFSKFERKTSFTSLASRITPYKISTGWAVLFQYNQDELYVAKCDNDGTNWTTALQLVDGTSSSRSYMMKPFGADKDSEGNYYLVVMPFYTDGAFVHTKFVIKTKDFTTFSNLQGTHSFTAGSPMTDVTLHTNGYAAVGTYNVAIEHDTACSGITREGLIYLFSWNRVNGDGNIKTTTFKDGAWVTVTASTGFNINRPNSVDGTNPMWCAVCSRSEIYLLMSISSKPHLLKSTNGGVSWTDLGDMLPSKSGYYRGAGPANIHEIPDDETFLFVFNENVFDNVTPMYADTYLVKASFGDRNLETPINFTDVVAAINDVPGARFIYSVNDFDSTTTGFYDLTGGGRTGTKVGSPVVSGGEVTFNGTNQMISVNVPTDFNADTQFTCCFVARLISGTSGYVISFANTASSTAFCYIMLTNTGLRIFRRSPSGTEETIQVDSTAFNTAVHNVITVTGDGSHYRIFVNGLELNKTYAIGSGIGDLINQGKWAASITGMNSVRISGLGRSGLVYSPLGIKDIAYWPTVISRTNRKKIENKLAADRGITITNYVE